MLRVPAVAPEARLLEYAEAEAEEADGGTGGLRRYCRMRSSVLVTAARTMYSLKAICRPGLQWGCTGEDVWQAQADPQPQPQSWLFVL